MERAKCSYRVQSSADEGKTWTEQFVESGRHPKKVATECYFHVDYMELSDAMKRVRPPTPTLWRVVDEQGHNVPRPPKKHVAK